MKVLSLFDGISCGMVALERAGIPVESYYASEIDKNAIAISQKNYPNIIRLGDVTKWREWDIPWAEIDLLIGGSPCQGFSFAGKQLNFNDPRSKLFFEFVDILNHIKNHNPNVKKFCYPFSFALFHSGYTAFEGEALSVEDAMAFNKRVDNRIRDYIVANTKITEEQYRANERRQWYLDAHDMKELGLIDVIIGEDEATNEGV